MPLASGPFALQPDSVIVVDAGKYDFAVDAQKLADQLSAIDAGWETSLTAIADLAVEPIVDELFPALDDVMGSVSRQLGLITGFAVDDLNDAFDVAAQQFDIASAFAPAAAWETPAAPFVPPGSNLTLTTPTIDVSAYVPSKGVGVGAPPAATTRNVAIYNTTRVGSPNFTVGDQYDIAIHGNPGDDVSVQATFNGEVLPLTSIGTLDERGLLGLLGNEGPEQVGTWTENWYVGGELVGTFSFIVSPAPS